MTQNITENRFDINDEMILIDVISLANDYSFCSTDLENIEDTNKCRIFEFRSGEDYMCISLYKDLRIQIFIGDDYIGEYLLDL